MSEPSPDEHRRGFVRPVRGSIRHRCGEVTELSDSSAIALARTPRHRETLYCRDCRDHFPLAEFVWVADGETVGS